MSWKRRHALGMFLRSSLWPLSGQGLSLPHRSAERFFTEPEDRALADLGDSQGVGGTPGSSWRVSP